MKKTLLIKLPDLKATTEMMRNAEKDVPVRKASGYYCKTHYDEYKKYFHFRAIKDGNIIKISVFLTEIMRAGSSKAAYDIYLDKENRDFITFDHKHNKWSNAKIDMLPWPKDWHYADKKYKDKKFDDFISKELDVKANGYFGILEWQQRIRAEQLKERHRKETAPWDEVMSKVKQKPGDWEKWVDKCGIDENFIFYRYQRGGATKGYCSWCEKEVDIRNPRHNGVGVCRNCGHKIVFKSYGKAGTVQTERKTMYLVQRYGDGIIVRQFEAYKKYRTGEYEKPELSVYEVRRTIFDKEFNGKAYYYGLYKQTETRWIYNGTPRRGYYFHSYAGKVYKRTIPSLKNLLSRTGLTEMIYGVPVIDPEGFLVYQKETPQLERLAKAGLTRLAYEMLYGHHFDFDDFDFDNAKSLAKALKIDRFRMQRLRNHNGGKLFLDWLNFEKIGNKSIDDMVIEWFSKQDIRPEHISFIADRMSEKQVKNYLVRQQEEIKMPVKEIISMWEDYLKMAIRAKMNVNDAIVYRAKKLRLRHDELVERLGSKNLAIRAGEIATNFPDVDTVCDQIRSKYEYENDVYAIMVPRNIEAIIEEGEALHHCIDRSDKYFERINNRESFILFLRKKEDIKKPWYTLEVEPGGTIRQKRTEYDRQNDDLKDAKIFLKAWQEHIQKNITDEDIRLAEESKNLRIREFEEMRKNNIKISHGHLSGHLLADVLETDLMENIAPPRRAM